MTLDKPPVLSYAGYRKITVETVRLTTIKTCKICKEVKPLAEFYKQGKYPQSYCKPCQGAYLAEYNRKRRLTVLCHYSGGIPTCACCGETRLIFLQIDHVDGGGAQHRRKIGAGTPITGWLLKNGLPEGFQVLCANCNLAKGFYGACPAQGNHRGC